MDQQARRCLPFLDVTLRNPIDPRVRLAYAIVVSKFAFGIVLIWTLGFTTTPMVWLIMGFSVALVPVGLFCSWLGNPRIGGTFQAMGLMYGQGVTGYISHLPLIATALPFQDGLISAADHALGFHWPTIYHATRDFAPQLDWVYRTFNWQSSILFIYLFAAGQEARAWRLLNVATITLLIVVMISILVPARGTAPYYGLSAGEPWVPILEYLRSGGRELTGGMFAGLISFPSYHAVACVLFAWAAWTTWLRWPFLVLNAVMLLATITQGSHYLVDVIAGAAIAWATLVAYRWFSPIATIVQHPTSSRARHSLAGSSEMIA